MKLTSEAGEITVDFGVAGNWTFSEMSLSKVQYTLNICFRLLLLLDDCYALGRHILVSEVG